MISYHRLFTSKPVYTVFVLLLVSSLIGIQLWHLSDDLYRFRGFHSSLSSATNDTLGFGGIYVLTEDAETWRIRGLQKAARLVDIHLTVPVQTRPTEDDIAHYLHEDKAGSHPDGIRALLNYLSLLETFLASGLETALFIEDDVDFSIHIKRQMELISATILNTTSTITSSGYSIAEPDPRLLYPYGKDWDVLWIGHYGVSPSDKTVTHMYTDPYALPWDHLSSPLNDYYEKQAKELQDGHGNPQQRVLYNVAPLVSNAFALTRPAAQRLIERLRKDRAQTFDLALHGLCRGDMLCAAPAPEVMHHHKVVGAKTIKDPSTADGKEDLKWWHRSHKWTYNVEWSARCNAAKAGAWIGGLWQCRPGRYDFPV